MRDRLISLLAVMLALALALTACDLNPTPTGTTPTPLAAVHSQTPSSNSPTLAALGETPTPTLTSNGQFAYIATDGSLHLRDLAGADVPLSSPIYSKNSPVPTDVAGTATAIFSPNGKYLAYRPLQSSEVHVIDVASALQSGPPWVLAATVSDVTGGFTWSADSLNLAVQTKTMVGSRKPISPDAVTIVNLAYTRASGSAPDLRGMFIWSPDGKRLAYARSDAIQLLSALDNSGSPTSREAMVGISNLYDMRVLNWSPDSRYITLNAATQEGGIPNLYLFDTQTQPPPMLLDEGGYAPQWSSDSKVIFYRKQADPKGAIVYHVHSISVNGTTFAAPGVYGESSWVVAPFVYDGPQGKGYLVNGELMSMDGSKMLAGLWSQPYLMLGWSPAQGNQHQAAIMDASSDPITRSLQVVSIPGGNVITLYTAHGPATAFYPNRPKMEALWSPDGKYLAFYAGGLSSVGDPPGPQNGVGIVDFNGRFTDSGLPDGLPLGWLGMGGDERALFSSMAYDAQGIGAPAIYALQPGGKAVKLADGVFLATRPSK